MKIVKVLFLLQNRWQYGARPGQCEWLPGWSPEDQYESWVYALHQSPTGKALAMMLPVESECYEVFFGNASPVVTAEPGSKPPMEPEYVLEQLQQFDPDLVVLLGKEAEKASQWLQWPVVIGPHPLYAKRFKPTELVRVREEVTQWVVSLCQEQMCQRCGGMGSAIGQEGDWMSGLREP